jgi:hypothetical protein
MEVSTQQVESLVASGQAVIVETAEDGAAQNPSGEGRVQAGDGADADKKSGVVGWSDGERALELPAFLIDGEDAWGRKDGGGREALLDQDADLLIPDGALDGAEQQPVAVGSSLTPDVDSQITQPESARVLGFDVAAIRDMLKNGERVGRFGEVVGRYVQLVDMERAGQPVDANVLNQVRNALREMLPPEMQTGERVGMVMDMVKAARAVAKGDHLVTPDGMSHDLASLEKLAEMLPGLQQHEQYQVMMSLFVAMMKAQQSLPEGSLPPAKDKENALSSLWQLLVSIALMVMEQVDAGMRGATSSGR